MQRTRKSAPLAWFNLEKYEPLKSASALDLALNISRRSDIASLLLRGDDLSKDEKLSTVWTEIKEHGALTAGTLDRALYDCHYHTVPGAEFDEGSGKGLVYSMPLSRAQDIRSTLNRWEMMEEVSKQPAFRKHWQLPPYEEDKRSFEELLKENATKTFDEDDEYYSLYSRNVCVSLSATDEELVAAFEGWLRRTRAELRSRSGQAQPAKRFSPTYFSRITDNRVIPYIDLLIHFSLAGQRQPQHKYGELLFPEAAVDSTEKIRKTVLPLTRSVLSDIGAILAQVLAEEVLNKSQRLAGMKFVKFDSGSEL